MLKVVIIGYGEMFTNMIAGTLDSGATIVGVLRHDRVKYLPPVRRLKEIFNPDCDYNYIKSYGLHEINANSANSDSFRKQLLKLNPDIMIVASWSEKIEKATFDIPKIATINVHPSLLPKYRGPNPYMQTILHGEEKSGVTFHLMTEKFDAGAILDQRTVEISDSDTGKELKAKTVLTARGAICELLEKLSEENKILIEKRYGLNGCDRHTQQQLADNMGIKRSTLAMRERNVLKCMRKELYSKQYY